MTVADRIKAFMAPPPRMAKAVTALGPWATDIPLSLWNQSPQDKAKAYLRAYKVGWFYKAGKKIADDLAALDWSVSSGDMEQGAAETVIDRPDLRAPFASLSPIDQFQRLLEAPVRDATGRVLVTGRQLFRKTEVRLDFAGAAAWYLEGGSSGLPSAIYGISPTRLWPSYDKASRLIGWVLDRDSPSGGTPFEVSEILWFSNGNADNDDLWGQSVVEAVYSQVPLTDLMARHTGDTLALGGRLSGMLWPKDRALTEDEYVDAQRAWRNVASDPNAARRMLIFPEPMEYAQGAATPEQIGIPDLATLSRDEILTAFPISPYRLGIPTPGGLNSGEVRREDRKDYWEETIHPRADLIKETIQVGLLSRYEDAMGQVFDFDIIEPDMDDAPTLVLKTQAYKGLVSIGLDPKESLSAAGLGHIKWIGLPPALDPTQPPPPPPPQQPPPPQVTKAAEVATDAPPLLAEFLRLQRDRITAALRERLPASKAARAEAVKSDPDWWDGSVEDAELAKALRVIYDDSSRKGLQTVSNELGRVVTKLNIRRVIDDIVQYGGDRISGINGVTLAAIKTALAEGTRRGYSVSQLIDGVPAEDFPGVLNALLDNGMGAWDDVRAEMITRTETALSYNRAALDGYKEFNVSEVQAIDGDGDEECAARDGQVYSVDEALSIEDHPNGTLDWVPVIGDKAQHDDDRLMQLATKALDALSTQPEIHVHNAVTPPDVHVEMAPTTIPVTVAAAEVNVPPTVVNVTLPEQPAADVRFEEGAIQVAAPSVMVEAAQITIEAPPAPEVHIEPAVVNVTVPEQGPAVVNLTVPELEQPTIQVDVHVPEAKPVKRTVQRNAKGEITGITDGG